jgi:hypothetical protein
MVCGAVPIAERSALSLLFSAKARFGIWVNVIII